ncbi:NACHT domain-containing protein [Archangium sp.]|uniref:NACHT domain-containing protein n=1 Tax=Archangium sp. TaxID=1872627 RepID=UPI002ED89E1A
MLLALVKLDLAGLPRELPEAESLRRRAQYTSGVEFVADKLAAAQPLQWQGDGVMLFFKGDERKSAIARALEAAEAIRERLIVDLAMQVRIAVHAASVPWNPETGRLAHPAIDVCTHLEQVAPINGTTVTEDVYLTLSEAEQRRFGLLGMTARDGVAAYVFPANLAARKDQKAFIPAEDLRLWEDFRRYVSSPEVRRLRYVGFPLQKKQPPSLDIREVFIPPEARVKAQPRPFLPSASQLLEGRGPHEDPLALSGSPRELAPPNLLEPITRLVERNRSLVVLGDPGSGKTTVLRWLAVMAAGGPLSWAEHLGPSERLLPIMVSVGRLAEIRERLGSVGSVIDSLAVYFHDRNVGGETELRGFLERTLEAGECLVLLDGLDEVRSEARASMLRWLETFCARFSRNRFVASARVMGYSGFSLPEGAETTLGPLNDEQVRRYAWAFERACRRWENDGTPDDIGADRESGKLLEALFRNPRLRDLARNPFLLSALVLIHRAEGQLPRHRVQAYEVFSRTLCETWSNARRIVVGESDTRSIRYEEEAVPILGELALRMHQEWPTGAAPEAFVIQVLAEAIQARDGGTLGDAERSAREFLERAGKEVQILLERGAGQWGFLHLTFQEFFTAVGLLSSERFEEVAFEHLFDPRWEEVLRLGVGYMALIQKRSQATQRFIRRVLEHEEQGGRQYVTALLRKQIYLAALLASEAGDTLPLKLQEEIARAVAYWNRRMPDAVVEPLLRELALTDFRERLLDVWTTELQSEAEWTRARAIFALGELRGERAQSALLPCLQYTSRWSRLALCESLRKLGTPIAAEALAKLAREAEHDIRMGALYSLFSSRLPNSKDLLTTIARDPEPGVTGCLILVLARMSLFGRNAGKRFSEIINPEALDDLLQRGLKHPEKSIQSATSRVLLLEKGPVFLESAAAKGDAHTAKVRQLLDLMSLRSEVPVDSLASDDVGVRALAAFRLALAKHESGISALLAMTKDTSLKARHVLIEAMGLIDDERVNTVLFTAARDSDPSIRAAALSSLGQLRAKGSEAFMIQALRDPDATVRASAIAGLRELEPLAALSPLMEIAKKAPTLNEKQDAIEVLWKLAVKGSEGSEATTSTASKEP